MNPMPKLHSCGILVKQNDKFLLAHSTQSNRVINRIDTRWSVPKGIIDNHESYLECAVREFFEETSINILDYYNESNLIFLTTINSPKKYNHIFYLDDIKQYIDINKMYCSSQIINEKYPCMNGLPEVDSYGWFSKIEAELAVFPSLKTLFSNMDKL